jgi:hypothetical protein
MLDETLNELAQFPGRLHRIYRAVPAAYRNWAPSSWDGIPSEQFTALEQICHVRDIEIDGYHERLRRMLETESPRLESIDSYAVAKQRGYGEEDSETVFATISSILPASSGCSGRSMRKCTVRPGRVSLHHRSAS